MTAKSKQKSKPFNVLRLGNQIPRIDIYQPGNTDKAELLFELLDEYGDPLLEWQKLVLRRWLAEDEDGNFVNTECGLEVSRQNGKTAIIRARIIYGIIFRKATGLFTAQQQDTADVVKKGVQDFFYENPHEEIFNLLTARFRKKPRNYDFMEFENGSSYKFKTRMRLSGLGNTNDELINDEAAEMMDAHQSTLMPTVSSSKLKNPQIIYAGTPPMAETVGEVFARVRKSKMSGGKGAWTEWSVESFTDKHDRDAWYQANPSLGYFLLLSAVEAEAESMQPDDFNRMRLGWWSGVEDKRAITQVAWEALINEKPEYDEAFRPIYAVKFSPDRSSFTLVAAQPLINGNIHVEIVMHRPMSEGYARLSKWLIERWRGSAKIIIDGQTGAPILYEELTHGGVPVKRILLPNMKEVVAAHQFMRDAIDRAELSHYNQPLLNQTVRATKERPFGRYGGFGWDSMSKNLSSSAIDAATYALWGQKVFAKKKPSNGDKKMSDDHWKQVLSSL
jgi:hypothetical protein